MSLNTPEMWYTISQAAAILGLSKNEVKKKYPFIVVDGVRLFHAKDLGYKPKTGAM